ncbi:hypothetical protein [Methylobacterium gnaphalii]|uniref:hypothetical protein n=1 Tax=Methylobacterium gnaphalii TaxID=1010610 RepID=UPI0011BE1FD1|nr:hypothetical protein [Methylobacterium gnaphalii]GJD70109.1 hypothetical protein MMMDOFMJ_3050 [Methylobacterium gnaphalii]
MTTRLSNTSPTRYRLTALTSDGHVLDTIKLNASDDAAALSLARVLAEKHAVELWDGLRFIQHIKPTG